MVDYRNAHNDDTYKCDRDIFWEDIDDTCTEILQVGSDLGRPRGRQTNKDVSRKDGILLRLKLSEELQENDMHRPVRDEWYEDKNSHMQRLDM